jgi:two-component sensor histidine kinase
MILVSAMLPPDRNEAELQVAEIRHRIANCFQLMISAIHCRLKQMTDPVARDQLAWALDIIRATSLLQGRLTSDAGQNFADYLRELAKYWQPLLEIQSVHIEVDADPIDLGPGPSSSLALIAQELVTNSVKHGFDGAGGWIRIELKQHDAEVELVVADNGRGAPKDGPAPSGVGMTIVRQLGNKIGAVMEFNCNESGAITRLRLPITGATAAGSPSCPSYQIAG